MSDNDIYHFGVKSMKWGVIRKKPSKRAVAGAIGGALTGASISAYVKPVLLSDSARASGRAMVTKVLGEKAGWSYSHFMLGGSASKAITIGATAAAAYAGVKLVDTHKKKVQNERR